MSEDSNVGKISDDGMWQWDGSQWQPTQRNVTARPQSPAVGMLSDDGQWRWNGTAWQPELAGQAAEPTPATAKGGRRKAVTDNSTARAVASRKRWEKAEVNRFRAKFDGAQIVGEFVRKGPVAIPVGGASTKTSITKSQITLVVSGRDGQSLTLVAPADKTKEAGAFTSILERASKAALLRERAKQGDAAAQREVDKAVAMTKRTSIVGAGIAALMVATVGACVATGGEEDAPPPSVAAEAVSVDEANDASSARAKDREAREARQAERREEKAKIAAQAALKKQREARAERQSARREQKRRAAAQAARDAREEQVSYANCSEAEAAGAAPIYEGEPGYSNNLDRDGDGIACDQ